jgi:hypothetical protein
MDAVYLGTKISAGLRHQRQDILNGFHVHDINFSFEPVKKRFLTPAEFLINDIVIILKSIHNLVPVKRKCSC